MPGWLILSLGKGADFMRKFITIDLPLSEDAAIYSTKWVPVDDRKIRNELNIKYRPLEDTVRDTMKWLIKKGHIKSQWGKNLL